MEKSHIGVVFSVLGLTGFLLKFFSQGNLDLILQITLISVISMLAPNVKDKINDSKTVECTFNRKFKQTRGIFILISSALGIGVTLTYTEHLMASLNSAILFILLVTVAGIIVGINSPYTGNSESKILLIWIILTVSLHLILNANFIQIVALSNLFGGVLITSEYFDFRL